MISDLGLVKQGLVTVEPEVRVFAPQPEGPPLTLWADAARTASELRERSAADAEAYPAFDRKVRSLASFLSYLHAITPPDVKDPSLADALNGVKLGNAFRRLGKKPGREATRALPMAIADYVAEAFESDAVRGAIASRAVQYTAMGPWSAGTTAVLLADSAGNDGGAPGQSTIARGGPGALAEALANAARGFGAEIRTGSEVVEISVERHRATGVVLADGSEIAGARGHHRDRPQAHAHDAPGPGRDRSAPALARDEHPDPRVGLEGRPRALGPAVVRRRRTRAPGRADRDRPVDRPPRAGVRRLEVRRASGTSPTWRRRSRRSRTRRSRRRGRT